MEKLSHIEGELKNSITYKKRVAMMWFILNKDLTTCYPKTLNANQIHWLTTKQETFLYFTFVYSCFRVVPACSVSFQFFTKEAFTECFDLKTY